MGSTTYDVIRKADNPVFVEKFSRDEEGTVIPAREQAFKKVMLPVDFSDCSYQVIERVKNLSESLERILLVNTIESGQDREELEEKKARAREKLIKIKKELQENQITEQIDIKITTGASSQKIIEIVEEKNIDTIAMATTGAGSLREILLGSTADRVVKHSPVSVLLYPCK